MSQQPYEQARIIFAGSPDFAVAALNVLVAAGHEVVGVLTQPDRPAGRGRKLHTSPVKDAAVAAGLPVLQPKTLKDPDVQQSLAALDADLMVVVAYGLLLPSAVLAQPRQGCVNLHASILPRWRGAAPIQAAILHGDEATGVSLMQMDEGLDTGPVLGEVSTPIGANDTGGELHDRLAELGAQLLRENLDALLAGALTATPQALEGATYAGRIEKQDGQIDWCRPAVEIGQQIRAYNPRPVAFTHYKEQALRCWSAVVSTGIDTDLNTGTDGGQTPGQILEVSAAGIAVATGAGVLTLTEVQLPGRKRVTALEFANANDTSEQTLG
jgi:methionyl-tRNA formyltransferase